MDERQREVFLIGFRASASRLATKYLLHQIAQLPDGASRLAKAEADLLNGVRNAIPSPDIPDDIMIDGIESALTDLRNTFKEVGAG